jgi:hypothetical protein
MKRNNKTIMNLFKLRIEPEESGSFFIEVEIRADQTFKDLHDFLVKTLNLKGDELASFFVADENWQKYEEITLLDMSGDEDQKLEENDETHIIYLMSKTRMDTFVSNVNQNLLYEYDFLQMHTFFIEVVQIKQPDNRMNYPRIANQSGQFKMVNKVNVEKDPEKLRESLLNEFNSMMKGDPDDNDDDINNDDY